MLKQLFIIIMMLSFSFANAQIVKDGNTFKKEKIENSKVETGYNWMDKDNKVYPILISKNDILYVERVSKKTGNTYRYYFDKEIQEELKRKIFEDKQNKK